jgi:hypothetical protein
MTENIRILEIFDELFKGNDAALAKYAKVRHTQYEIKLWREHGLPLKEVNKGAKFYFSKRFLNGKKIEEATEEEIKGALETLNHAVNDGCKGRCTRLVEELNDELKKYYIEPVKIQSFLDWATFSYVVRKDDFTGQPCKEPGHSFEIWDFHDEYNRKEFYEEVKRLAKKGEFLHPGHVGQIVDIRRKYRKKL